MSSLTGTVQDRLKVPVNGARITLWDQGIGKEFQTTSLNGLYFIRVPPGEYLLKVEMPGMALLYGAVRLTPDNRHDLNLVLAKKTNSGCPVHAESPVPQKTPAPPASQAPKAARAPVKPARLLRQVKPVWPAVTKASNMTCGLRVAAVIRTDGAIDDMIVLSAPDLDFALALLTTVRQWRYSPTYLDGKAVEVMTIIDVNIDY